MLCMNIFRSIVFLVQSVHLLFPYQAAKIIYLIPICTKWRFLCVSVYKICIMHKFWPNPEVSECVFNSSCSQICTNTIGSYICSCRPGYILDIDNRNCNGMFCIRTYNNVSLCCIQKEVPDQLWKYRVFVYMDACVIHHCLDDIYIWKAYKQYGRSARTLFCTNFGCWAHALCFHAYCYI